jgi:hypothetical protein
MFVRVVKWSVRSSSQFYFSSFQSNSQTPPLTENPQKTSTPTQTTQSPYIQFFYQRQCSPPTTLRLVLASSYFAIHYPTGFSEVFDFAKSRLFLIRPTKTYYSNSIFPEILKNAEMESSQTETEEMTEKNVDTINYELCGKYSNIYQIFLRLRAHKDDLTAFIEQTHKKNTTQIESENLTPLNTLQLRHDPVKYILTPTPIPTSTAPPQTTSSPSFSLPSPAPSDGSLSTFFAHSLNLQIDIEKYFTDHELIYGTSSRKTMSDLFLDLKKGFRFGKNEGDVEPDRPAPVIETDEKKFFIDWDVHLSYQYFDDFLRKNIENGSLVGEWWVREEKNGD